MLKREVIQIIEQVVSEMKPDLEKSGQSYFSSVVDIVYDGVNETYDFSVLDFKNEKDYKTVKEVAEMEFQDFLSALK